MLKIILKFKNMKLESLKNDKFEAFKENEIQNAMKVVGGRVVLTNNGDNCDSVDYSCWDHSHTDGAGTKIDYKEWS